MDVRKCGRDSSNRETVYSTQALPILEAMHGSVCIAVALTVLWAMAVAQPLLTQEEDEPVVRQKQQQRQQDQQGQGLGFGGLGQGGGLLDAFSGIGTQVQQAASDFPSKIQDAAGTAANAFRTLFGNVGQTLSQGASSG